MLTLRQCSFAVACSALLAAGHSANAQFRDATRPNTRGFFVKFSGAWTTLRADSINTRADGGLGTSLDIGLGLTRYVAIAFDGGGQFYRRGEIDNYHTGEFHIGLRFHYPREDHRLVPYADLMAAGVFLRIDSIAAANGPVGTSLAKRRDVDCSCFTLGAGLLYFVTSTMAVDGSAHWTSGNFKTTTPASPYRPILALPSETLRLNLGLAWYPDTQFRLPHGG